MPIRLNQLKAKTKTAVITYDGEPIEFAYRPNEFTIELAEGIAAAAEKEDLASVTLGLAPVVEWWDVLDEDDNRIPPTAENMRRFPLNFLMSIMSKVQEDLTPTAPRA